MSVFVVQHVYARGPDRDETKLIGVYASEEAARAAVATLVVLPGFREHPAGFSVEAHELDDTQWREGFADPAPPQPVIAAPTHAQLEALFEALGAPEPGEWAASQVAEGIPQLHRFLFLRQAWKACYAEDKPAWIDGLIRESQRHPDAPYASVGAVLAKLRAAGITDEEITDLVRGVQAELLFAFCYLLEDPNIEEEQAEHVTWGLLHAKLAVDTVLGFLKTKLPAPLAAQLDGLVAGTAGGGDLLGQVGDLAKGGLGGLFK